MATEKLTVLNPEGFPPKVVGRGLAPPLDTLSGKKVFLVDVGFESSDEFMAQLKGRLAEEQPDLETEVVRWKNQHLPDPELSERIQAEGDAAILGVGT